MAAMALPCTTRASLIDRVCRHPGDPGAWSTFVSFYGPAVIRWCRRHGLQESDAADVAQEVLLRFWRHAGKFRYDPDRSFRAYLRRMVLTAVSDWAESRETGLTVAGSDALQTLLDRAPAREDLAVRLERMFDTELVAIAMAEVESRVSPRTWKAFRMLAIEGIAGRDVAASLGMDLRHVYVARSEVQAKIRDLIGAEASDGKQVSAGRASRDDRS